MHGLSVRSIIESTVNADSCLPPACKIRLPTEHTTFTDLSLYACKQDDATEADWYDVTALPALAFDHKLIIRTAFEHLLQHSQTKTTGEFVLQCSCLGFS